MLNKLKKRLMFFKQSINNGDQLIVITSLPSQLTDSEVANVVFDGCESADISPAEIYSSLNVTSKIGELYMRVFFLINVVVYLINQSPLPYRTL
jgi:hypothetical protein